MSARVAEVMDADALQRTNTENLKQIYPEKELCGHSSNFHIHVSVSDLYIPMIDLHILLQEICGLNVEIGTEAAQFPKKGYQLQLQFSAGNLRRRRGKLVMNSFAVIDFRQFCKLVSNTLCYVESL